MITCFFSQQFLWRGVIYNWTGYLDWICRRKCWNAHDCQSKYFASLNFKLWVPVEIAIIPLQLHEVQFCMAKYITPLLACVEEISNREINLFASVGNKQDIESGYILTHSKVHTTRLMCTVKLLKDYRTTKPISEKQLHQGMLNNFTKSLEGGNISLYYNLLKATVYFACATQKLTLDTYWRLQTAWKPRN